MTPPPSKNNRAREKATAARAAQLAAERRARIVRWSAIASVFVVIAAVIIVIAVNRGGGSSTPAATPSTPSKVTLGPEGIPIEQGTVLASASSASTGQTVDGVQCQTNEQVAYHIHVHLAVYVNGQLRPIPLGIGIVKPVVSQGFAQASQCYYWLHVHVQDGVIHIESPTKTIYTLGQFFDEWHQPLSSTQVATAKGTVTAYLNGKPYTGNLRSIPLNAHNVIQFDVGAPTVAPQPVNWATSSL
jgi:hypothetical protein